MKKCILTLLISLVILPNAFSQQCLPNGIVFNTQSEIDSFQANYPNCTEILGDVEINDNQTGNITKLDGLDVLTSIDGYLKVKFTGGLKNLIGLDNLTSIGGTFLVGTNDSIEDLSGLLSLTYIGGVMDIGINPLLKSLTGLNNLDSVGGNVLMGANNSLTTLTALNNVHYVGGKIEFGNNHGLTNFNGFANLISVGGEVYVGNCNALTTISSFNNLTNIGDRLSIGTSGALTSITGFNNLNSIAASLNIYDNNALDNISGFAALTSIGGDLRIYENDILPNLIGLENIDAATIVNLAIYNNASLSHCEVKSVCDYLLNPNGTVYIAGNTGSCTNRIDVEAACAAVSVKEKHLDEKIDIYPDPAWDEIFIDNESDHKISDIRILNLTGQTIMEVKSPLTSIDISKLKPGLYIVELTTEKCVLQEKLLKK